MDIDVNLVAHAKDYIEDLARGINPLTKNTIDDDDVINNVKISRCLFYVSDVLGEIVDNGGIGTRKASKPKQTPFDPQQLDMTNYPYSAQPIGISVIAKRINELKPDIVWVSLGAPKQETFISKIFPYIEQGVLFGIGAAFNFYTGDLHNNKKEIGGLRFIWLERIFKEPKKQLTRVGGYLMMVPKMYFQEKRKAKLASKNTK
jgi:hypothetical protein